MGITDIGSTYCKICLQRQLTGFLKVELLKLSHFSYIKERNLILTPLKINLSQIHVFLKQQKTLNFCMQILQYDCSVH